jgi:hypothetical protein
MTPYESLVEVLKKSGALLCPNCQSHMAADHDQDHKPRNLVIEDWSGLPGPTFTTPVRSERPALPYQTRLVVERVPDARDNVL